MNRRKASLHKRITEVRRRLITFIFDPCLDSGNHVFVTVTQTVTCSFSRFFTTKVTNNAGPKFMCLSSSLFVTYLSETVKLLVVSAFGHCYEKCVSRFHVRLWFRSKLWRSSHIPRKLGSWMCYAALIDSFEQLCAFSISRTDSNSSDENFAWQQFRYISS